MKKLLTILSALVLVSSASIPVSGWASQTSTYKSADEKQAAYISEATSFALRGAVLNDQKVSIRGVTSDKGIDFNYATQYFGNLKIKDVMPDAFKSNQGAKPTDEDVVSTAYGSLFGADRSLYGYTIKDSINGGDLSTSGVKEGTNLYNIVKNKSFDNPTGNLPDSSTQGLISTIIGAAQIALGNDFSAGLASTLVNVLSGDSISKLILQSSTKDKFQQLDNLLSKYGEQITNAINSITQSSISENDDLTLGDEIENSTVELFKALIFITTYKDKDDNGNAIAPHALIFDDKKSVEDYGDASTRFWDHLLNVKNNDKNDDSFGLTDATGDLQAEKINQYAKIISFAMDLVHLFRSLDNYDKDIRATQDGSYLFDNSLNKTNGQIKAEVLSKKIKDDNDWWVNDGNNKYVKFNLQNLFSDLSYFFSSNKNHSLRMINTLLGGVYDSKTKENKLNPILQIALVPLLNIAKSKSQSIVKTIKSILGVIPIKGLNQLGDTIGNLIDNLPLYADQLLDWISTDGSKQADGLLPSLIKSLFKMVGSISLFTGENAIDIYNSIYQKMSSDKDKLLARIIISAVQFIANDGDNFISHPWSYMFDKNNGHSIFSDLAKLYYFDGQGSKSSDRMLGNILLKIKNLNTVFNTDLSTLSGYLFKILNSTSTIPDWLYDLKDYSISKVFANLANNIYHTKDIYNLAKNNSFIISSEAFSNMVSSLLPHAEDQTEQIRISRKPAWITSSPSCDDTTTPYLNSPVYDADKKTITIETINIPDGDVKSNISGLPDGIVASASVSNGSLVITLSKALEQKDNAYGQNFVYSANGKSASVSCFVSAAGKTNVESVSPIMAFYYSLENFNKASQGLNSLKIGNGLYWDYDIQLPDSGEKTWLIRNDPAGNNVNPQALNYLLGLTKVNKKDAFAKNSLFQAISQLYGHNFNDGVYHSEMTSGAQSIFALASSFSDLATSSINEVVAEFYKPYFDEKNWKVDNVHYSNLSPKTGSIDEKQRVTYDLHFYNFTEKKWHLYTVQLDRTPYDSSYVGWQVTKLLQQK